MTSEDIARVCHEANRAYCDSLGDTSQLDWNSAPEWQRRSAVQGVVFALENPNAGPSAQHDAWLKAKQTDGWTYGEVKDAEKKTHPCCVPYDQLPISQQKKDALFRSIVTALRD